MKCLQCRKGLHQLQKVALKVKSLGLLLGIVKRLTQVALAGTIQLRRVTIDAMLLSNDILVQKEVERDKREMRGHGCN